MREEGFNVVRADAEHLDLGKQFDCIVAGEVIEHLSNPGLFLDAAHRHLVPGGRLIITVPNAFGLKIFWRIFRKNEVKVHAEHTCWYDPLTISQLLNRHAFKIEYIFFSNKHKWYRKRYFFKLKYQIPKLVTWFRPLLSGTIIVIARRAEPPSSGVQKQDSCI